MTALRRGLRSVGRHRLLLVGVALAAAFGASLPASEPLMVRLVAWVADDVGSGRAASQSVPAGRAPTGTSSGRDVTLSWEQIDLSGGTPAAGYVVRRYSLGGGEHTVLAGCSGLVTTLSCVEAAVPTGSWRYTVTPRHPPWTGAESPPSATVTVGSASLAFTGSTTITTLPATLAGTVSGFLSNDTITFRLDSPTGPVLNGTPATVGTGGSATVTVDIPTGTSDAPHSVFVTGSDGATASAPITVVDSPTMVALEAFDTDANGKFDRVTATFDEALAPYTAGTTPWTLASPPSGATLASVAVSGTVATLTLTEGSGAATTAIGSFTVALATDPGGVRDANGHRSSFASTAPADRAAPAPTTGPSMFDSVSVNGKVDQLTVVMSETLATYTAGTAPVSLTDVPSGGTLSAVTVSSTTVTITLTEGPGAPDTSVGSFTIALAASPTGVRDAAGNLSTISARPPTDKAAPAAVTRLGFDDDGDALFDRVAITFSETLAPYTASTTGWSIGTGPSGATLASVSATGSEATLLLTEGTGTPTTAVASTFRIGLTANAAGIRDAADNRTAISASSVTVVEDRAAPFRNLVTLVDNSADGKVDGVTVTWTETISATYTAGTAPWTLTGTPSGGTLASITNATTVTTLNITEGSGAADTSVGAMTVAMTTSTTGVRDASGNLARGFGALPPTDGASPVPLAMTDTNGRTDGRIEPGDTASISFSEPLAAATVPTTTTVTLADPTGTGNDTLSITGITNGARATGSDGYVTADGTSAAFASTVGLSADRKTIVVTVGPTCSGSGCGAIGKATSATTVSLLCAITITDGTVAVTTTAKSFTLRLF